MKIKDFDMRGVGKEPLWSQTFNFPMFSMVMMVDAGWCMMMMRK